MYRVTAERSLVHDRVPRPVRARADGPTLGDQVATSRRARAGGPPKGILVSPTRHARGDANVPYPTDTVLVQTERVRAYEIAGPVPMLVAAEHRMIAQAADSSDSSTDLAIGWLTGPAMNWACGAARLVQSSFVPASMALTTPAASVRDQAFSQDERRDQAETASCILWRSRAELFRRGRWLGEAVRFPRARDCGSVLPRDHPSRAGRISRASFFPPGDRARTARFAAGHAAYHLVRLRTTDLWRLVRPIRAHAAAAAARVPRREPVAAFRH